MKDKERDKIVSRICEVQLYLTTKIIDRRNTDYRPNTDDADQPLRDEITQLRKKLGIIK
jgi:hypothetical protein